MTKQLWSAQIFFKTSPLEPWNGNTLLGETGDFLLLVCQVTATSVH